MSLLTAVDAHHTHTHLSRHVRYPPSWRSEAPHAVLQLLPAASACAPLPGSSSCLLLPAHLRRPPLLPHSLISSPATRPKASPALHTTTTTAHTTRAARPKASRAVHTTRAARSKANPAVHTIRVARPEASPAAQTICALSSPPALGLVRPTGCRAVPGQHSSCSCQLHDHRGGQPTQGHARYSCHG